MLLLTTSLSRFVNFGLELVSLPLTKAQHSPVSSTPKRNGLSPAKTVSSVQELCCKITAKWSKGANQQSLKSNLQKHVK